MSEDLDRRVALAHGDAWQELGRIHAATGGGVHSVPGARLMASGLAHPAYNNADVDDPSEVEVSLLSDWYADRGVPWGVRVPAGAGWSAGRHLFRKELHGLEASWFAPAGQVEDLEVVRATTDDLVDVVGVDLAAFGGEPAMATAWLGPLVVAPAADLVLARLGGTPVAAAYTIRTDGLAGPAAYLGGVGVVPDARRRGIAADLSSRLLARALDGGVALVHCHPEPGGAARVYERLGFRPAGAFDVYVDLG